jgi:hypothetical protein
MSFTKHVGESTNESQIRERDDFPEKLSRKKQKDEELIDVLEDPNVRLANPYVFFNKF